MKAKIKQFLLMKVKEIQEKNILDQKAKLITEIETNNDIIGMETQNSTFVADMTQS